MKSTHESDDAFEAWVDGEEHLRNPDVQAAFRAGSNAGRDAERAARGGPMSEDEQHWRVDEGLDGEYFLRDEYGRLAAEVYDAETAIGVVRAMRGVSTRATRAEGDLAEALAQIAKLTAALAWYADPANSDRGPNVIPWTMNISRDRGQRARAALDMGEQPVRPGVLGSALCDQHWVRLCATCAGYEGGSPDAEQVTTGEPAAEEADRARP